MSVVLFVAVTVYQLQIYHRYHKQAFINDKVAFGAQVAKLVLPSLQTSSYFDLYRISGDIFSPSSMFYIVVYDEHRRPIHIRTKDENQSLLLNELKGEPNSEVSERKVLDHRLAVIQSQVKDPASRSWGAVEIGYDLSQLERLTRGQILAFGVFFLLFASIWIIVFQSQTRAILRPLNKFVGELSNLQSAWPISIDQFNSRLVPSKSNSEVNVLLKIIHASLWKIFEYEKAQRRAVELTAMGRLAAQVAHDIRSPLAALESILGKLSQLPEQERIIVRSAVNRINDIANTLVAKNQEIKSGGESVEELSSPLSTVVEPKSLELLWSLIDPIITEKRMQFRSRIGLDIDGKVDAASYGLFAEIQPLEFKRMLSNLINNSIEAIGEKGTVVIDMNTSSGKEIRLQVRDDGCGIAPEILSRLGERGETHGKPGGSGLGLYHARKAVESWRGRFTILSEVGKGTSVNIILPKAYPPEWFVSELEVAPNTTVVVLDDDNSIHQVWHDRFSSLQASKRGIEVVDFLTPEEMRSWVLGNAEQSQAALFLVDYELLGHTLTGLDLIAVLNLNRQSILVTSRFEEQSILKRCQELRVRIVPKKMAAFVPIELRTPSENFDCVLIDDDLLVHMTWNLAAKKAGRRMLGFQRPDDFLGKCSSIDRNIPVYVDANLGNDIRGEEIAKKAFDLGFRNVFLMTGESPEDFVGLTFLSGIRYKNPPW
ncbi:MAG: HAMP domain-containing histidine kinase [Deltaproteobacteria bacterium]|nr:HAMP domain-containing histidine kinase [Deltaproteobacteria bacterium]